MDPVASVAQTPVWGSTDLVASKMLSAIASPVKFGYSFLLVFSIFAIGLGQLADPEYASADATAGEVFEVLPEASLNHYL